MVCWKSFTLLSPTSTTTSTKVKIASVPESDQDVEGAEKPQKYQVGEEALGSLSTTVRKILGTFGQEKVRTVEALHEASVLVTLDEAVGSNASMVKACCLPNFEVGAQMFLKAAFAFNLTELDDDGKVWDLSVGPTDAEASAGKAHEKKKPCLLIVSPTCTLLHQLPHLNVSSAAKSRSPWPHAFSISCGAVFEACLSWEGLCRENQRS